MAISSSFHSPKQARGVSLIEILVAVLVLSIGLLGLAALQGFTLQANQGAYHRTQAVTLTYDIVDFLRTNRGAPDALVWNDWDDRIAEQLPGGTLAVTQAGDLWTVAVTWQDDRLGDQPGPGESVQVTSRL